MSINNLLFSIQNMSPAMLSVGVGKTQNYNNLADLSSGLLGNSSSSSSNGLLGTNSATDTVSLTYKKIGDQIVNDLASATASTIKEYPDLDGDYVIAIVDNGSSREARVYKRSDILDNFEGSDKEKEALKKQLETNPLMVFSSASGLPDSSSDPACQKMAANLNEVLKTANKTLNTLSNAGYDPLADMAANSTMKKILVNCAGEASTDKTNKSAAAAFLEDIQEVVDEALKKYSELKGDYVVAIIDDGSGSREAKVYSRAEILANFEGTDEERAALKKQLDDNPVMVFSNGNGLPDSDSSTASQYLATQFNSLLKDNSSTLNNLDKAGYDPLADMLGSSTMKKYLASFAQAMVSDEE